MKTRKRREEEEPLQAYARLTEADNGSSSSCDQDFLSTFFVYQLVPSKYNFELTDFYNEAVITRNDMALSPLRIQDGG